MLRSLSRDFVKKDEASVASVRHRKVVRRRKVRKNMKWNIPRKEYREGTQKSGQNIRRKKVFLSVSRSANESILCPLL